MTDEQDGTNKGGQPKITTGAAYREGFTAVPNIVVRNRQLSGNAKALFAIMLDAAWLESEPELEELGAQIGGGKKTAVSAVKELVDAGFVTSRRRGQGRTNAYILHHPDEALKCREGTSRSSRAAVASYKDVEDHDVPDKSGTSAAGTIKRARRPVFDAIADATGANAAASGGQIAKAEKAIRSAEEGAVAAKVQEVLAASPEMEEVPTERIDAYLIAKIYDRASSYREHRPEWELTPSALATHWLRIPTWSEPTRPSASAAEQAWQRVIALVGGDGNVELTERERLALKAIGGSFTIRTATHLPTVRSQFVNAWDTTRA